MGLEIMTDEAAAAPSPAAAAARVEIYPLCRYYFGARDVAAGGAGAGLETTADRALRLKAKYARARALPATCSIKCVTIM